MAQPVVAYIQDAHPISDAKGYAKYNEAKGFGAACQAESRLGAVTRGMP